MITTKARAKRRNVIIQEREREDGYGGLCLLRRGRDLFPPQTIGLRIGDEEKRENRSLRRRGYKSEISNRKGEPNLAW